MNTENLVIIAVLLILLGEVTYLVTKLPRQTNGKKRMIFVDTSVVIDGRIIAVAKSGFIGDTLVIPRSVIGELQFLADNADHDKRARARYGLDIVKELQEMAEVDVTILQDGSKAEEGVDERLLKLAKKHGGVICTIDYNLNKVAVVEGITVLNVNELAQSLRMAYLPGEKILLELVQKGQDGHQAVGYLADGTMVVVEHASKNIGQTIEIEFIRSLQTAAGKMMFAKPIESAQPNKTKTALTVNTPKVKRQSSAQKENAAVQKTNTSAVYHSDAHDQRSSPYSRQRSTGRSVRRSQNQPPSSRSEPPKFKTSSQHEATLIDLVDKQ